MSSLCVHLYIIDKSINAELLAQKRESLCYWCNASGQNTWLCLYTGCLKVGCGEMHNNHSGAHNSSIPSHCIWLNLTNFRAWCYMCEFEVTNWVIGSLNVAPGQHLGGVINAPGVHLAQPMTPTESSAEDTEDDLGYTQALKPKGLVGLRNLGLTCYMNAAIQALSNSVPLTCFMRECSAFLSNERRQPSLVRSFYRLMLEIWHEKRPSYVAPSNLIQAFRQLYPMFRPYTQQDSQEFLRYLMDQLHQELKLPHMPQVDFPHEHDNDDENEESSSTDDLSEEESLNVSPNDSSQESSPHDSEVEEYETCDSGLSDVSASSHSNTIGIYSGRGRRRRIDSDPNSRWKAVRKSLTDLDQSEFSDAMSETSLLDKRARIDTIGPLSSPRVHSSLTSGLGSSKPSSTSLSSSSAGRPILSGAMKVHPSISSKVPTVKKSLSVTTTNNRRKKSIRYRSIISDTFDGALISSVQCLTCNTVSSRKETFQDLSLPIPSPDQLTRLQNSPQQQHQQNISSPNPSNFYLAKNTCDVTGDGGWMWWLWSLFRSWFWGPTLTLCHCLAAFFSADELKGDNMYSCDKCGKLRNGIKYSKVVQLPEILIVHLKRFRHEYMFSSKISQHISFPLHGLDLSPFLHKECTSTVRTYDLYAVICHHGAVGAGHYTSYSQNLSDNQWYEFDDQCVTQVSQETVSNCEAYVLFYKKVSPEMSSRRLRTIELMQVSAREPSLMQFYVSKQWLNKFNTFAEPGPIDNSDFLCPHGGVQPLKAGYVAELVMLLSQGVWEYLHQFFGGGPPCTRLYECVTCREELDCLLRRQTSEYETFIQLHSQFQQEENPSIVYAIAMRWFCTWEAFVRGRQHELPGPIDNSSICINKHGQQGLKIGSDYASISEEMWQFFHSAYGGGPELLVRYVIPTPCCMYDKEDRNPEQYGRENDSSSFKRSTRPSRSLSTDDLPYRESISHQTSSTDIEQCFTQRTVSESDIFLASSYSSYPIRNSASMDYHHLNKCKNGESSLSL